MVLPFWQVDSEMAAPWNAVSNVLAYKKSNVLIKQNSYLSLSPFCFLLWYAPLHANFCYVERT